MNKYAKIYLMVALIATLVVVSGCNLKASTPPTGSATATSEMNFITPTATADVKGDILTQTAQAQQPGVATATPTTGSQPEATTAPVATKAPDTSAAATKAPTAKPAAVSIPTLTRPSTYTLHKGEHPYCIARRYDLDISSLLSINGLNSSSILATGAVLKIPSTGNWNTAIGSRTLHTHADYKVNSGDTVYSIACYFGDVSPEGILAANGLSSASDVKSGMTLKIP